MEEEYQYAMDELRRYQNAALKLAVIKPMEDEGGYSATIPGFHGLIVFGDTIKGIKKELASVLEGWIAVSLRRGNGLPVLSRRQAEMSVTG